MWGWSSWFFLFFIQHLIANWICPVARCPGGKGHDQMSMTLTHCPHMLARTYYHHATKLVMYLIPILYPLFHLTFNVIWKLLGVCLFWGLDDVKSCHYARLSCWSDENAPFLVQVLSFLDDIFPALLKALSDSSDEVGSYFPLMRLDGWVSF